MTVYVVIMEAVYDHGVWGVYTDLESAKERCRGLWERSDGHHNFRIEEMPVDVDVDGDGNLGEANREHRMAATDQFWQRYRDRMAEPADDHITVVARELI